jgi:nitronate monooxygenase
VARLKAQSILWCANISTVAEAKAAEAAGADLICAQGMEAGGHRGTFDGATAERHLVGTLALVPAVSDAVSIPVIAAGGIGDGRGVAAVLALGASAAAIGSSYMRCPEAGLPSSWVKALGAVSPEDTMITRGFSGRAGRALPTRYVQSVAAPGAPKTAPYPVQRGLTANMRKVGTANNDVDLMQAWSGQSARLGADRPAGEMTKLWWEQARAILD